MKLAPRLLFVDDEPWLVELVAAALAQRGCEVDGHADPRAAVAAFAAAPERFDAVISDVNMPGMSGLDVLRAVLACSPGKPVALASGFVDATLEAQARDAGAHALLRKSTSLRDLADQLHAFVMEASRPSPRPLEAPSGG